MKTYNTQEELNADLNEDGDLIIADDVEFTFDVEIRGNINAWNISYYKYCIASETFKCISVKGRRENSIHACLDGEIEYITKEK